MAIETLLDGNIVEIVGLNHSTVSTYTENSGKTNEKKTFNLSGRMKIKTGSKIGTMKITAPENKFLVKNPILSRTSINRLLGNKSKVRAKTTSVEKNANGQIISCKYDLIYTSKESVNRGNALNYNVATTLSDIVSRTTGIYHVSVGDTSMGPHGQLKEIVVYGTPGYEFQIAISKFTDYKDTNLNITNSTEEDILPKGYSTTAVLGDGKTVRVVKEKIPISGKYSFKQSFSSVTSETRYSINILASCVDSAKFPISDWTTWSNQWVGWYGKIITQFINPKLTLKVETSSWSTVTMDSNGDGTFETFNSSNPISYTYPGKYNTIARTIKAINILKTKTITYTIKSASQAFSSRSGSDGSGGTLGTPVFSNINGNESDWTNSVHKDDPSNGVVGNGGTHVKITNISDTVSTTSSSNDTLTIKFDIEVVRWGTKDVTMTLNVDNIKTLS